MQSNPHMGYDTLDGEVRLYIDQHGRKVTVDIVKAANGNEFYKLLVRDADGQDLHNNEWFNRSYVDLASARHAQHLHIENFQKSSG